MVTTEAPPKKRGDEANLYKVHPKEASSIEEITPDLARDYLDGGINFRKASQAKVDVYACAMREGRWDLQGDTVKFDEFGRLVDGQHRMLACLEANTNFHTFVARGVKDDTYVDTGRPRTTSQLLQSYGYENSADLGALARACWFYDKGPGITHLSANRAPDSGLILEYVQDNETGLVHTVSMCLNAKFMVPVSVLGYVHFLGGRIAQDTAKADEFIIKVTKGEGIVEGNPAYAIRDRYIRLRSERGRANKLDMIAMTIRCWNAYVKGAEVKRVFVKKTGLKRWKPETFPRFVRPQD